MTFRRRLGSTKQYNFLLPAKDDAILYLNYANNNEDLTPSFFVLRRTGCDTLTDDIAKRWMRKDVHSWDETLLITYTKSVSK